MSNETTSLPTSEKNDQVEEPKTIGETISWFGKKIWNKIHDVGDNYIEKPLQPLTDTINDKIEKIPFVNKAYRIRKDLSNFFYRKWEENPYYFGGAIDATLSYVVPPDEWRAMNDANDVANTLIYGTAYKSRPKWNFRASRFWSGYRLRKAQLSSKWPYYKSYNRVKYEQWRKKQEKWKYEANVYKKRYALAKKAIDKLKNDNQNTRKSSFRHDNGNRNYNRNNLVNNRSSYVNNVSQTDRPFLDLQTSNSVSIAPKSGVKIWYKHKKRQLRRNYGRKWTWMVFNKKFKVPNDIKNRNFNDKMWEVNHFFAQMEDRRRWSAAKQIQRAWRANIKRRNDRFVQQSLIPALERMNEEREARRRARKFGLGDDYIYGKLWNDDGTISLY